jgi:uncharacterized protein (TIGR03435 family)
MPSRHLRGVPVSLLLLAGPAAAQELLPRFEVATLKISPPPTGDAISVNLGAFRNGRFTFANVTLSDAVMYAFDLPSKELLAGIDWQDSVRFDVVALAPAETPQPRLRLMVRQLLEERLALETVREQRTLRHIALVVDRNGSKMKEAIGPPESIPQFPGRINHKRMPMGLLASLLSRFEHQLIVDQTGLSGSYEVMLEWAPDVVAPPGDTAGPPADRPNLSTAVAEQLGLRLEGRRGPLEVVVITGASRTPAEN